MTVSWFVGLWTKPDFGEVGLPQAKIFKSKQIAY
jgi:hypothetical protein